MPELVGTVEPCQVAVLAKEYLCQPAKLDLMREHLLQLQGHAGGSEGRSAADTIAWETMRLVGLET